MLPCPHSELSELDMDKNIFIFLCFWLNPMAVTQGQTQEFLLNSEAPRPNLKFLISCDLPTYEWLPSLKWCSVSTLQECTEYWFEVAKNPLVALLIVVFVTVWDNFDISVPSSYARGQHVQSPLCPTQDYPCTDTRKKTVPWFWPFVFWMVTSGLLPKDIPD